MRLIISLADERSEWDVFPFFWSKSQTYWKKAWISSYWHKTTYKKHFTNLSSLENYLLFLYPLMYSLTKEETIQTRKYHVTYLFEMICKSVNCNDLLSCMFTKPTRTSARESFQRKHSEVNQMSLSFWGLRHWMHWK